MKRPLLAVAAAAMISSSACSVGPRYHTPAAPAPPAYQEPDPSFYKEAGDWKRANPSDAMARGKWWEMFGDPELNELEPQIDGGNQNLKAVAARFEQARALIRLNRSAGRPSIDVGGDISGNRGSANTVIASPKTTSSYGSFSLPIDFNWEIDTFGRIRNSVEAARTEAQATAADMETVRLSLHSELAFDYFELRSLDAQKELLDNTVVAYQKALDLTRNRFEGGATSAVEVEQARTQLESTRAQAQDVGVQRAQYEHAIAVLTGRPPYGFSLAPKSLDTPPPVIPPGLPSQLLERRPDIAAAERRVAEGNAEIGIARAAYYPSVMLSTALGLEGSSITNWFNWPSRFWAVGPAVLQTVFDGGRRKAQSQIAQASYDEAVARYRQTTLDAFQQVEDNLAAERILAQESETQKAAVAAAQRSLQLSMNRYEGGLVTYLEVVTAQSAALANQRASVDILRRRMAAAVLLVKALGGGWDVTKLPTLATK
jgi:NodT family efflux transporter outer membrane factor (OMF) lipoprotein